MFTSGKRVAGKVPIAARELPSPKETRKCNTEHPAHGDFIERGAGLTPKMIRLIWPSLSKTELSSHQLTGWLLRLRDM